MFNREEEDSRFCLSKVKILSKYKKLIEIFSAARAR